MGSSSVPSGRDTKALRRRGRITKNRHDRMGRRRRLRPALEPLEARYLLAFTTQLLGDINQFGIASQPESLTEFNSEVFFVADDGKTGAELWKSDGTDTVQVADLLPGPEGSHPEELTVVGGELFFVAADEGGGFDLWKTDGSTTGTVKVFEADDAGVYDMSNLTESNGNLFFSAYELATGNEIWMHDPTTSGTMLVSDINSVQDVYYGPQSLTDVNGTLFFSTYSNGEYNRELFKTDGTELGTMLVLDIDGDPLESSNPSQLTNIDGTLYFTAETPDDGVELYKSDGMAAGTLQVANLNPGSASSDPLELTSFDGDVFFSADDGGGRKLFRSNGTTITLATSPDSVADPSFPSELTVVGSDLFFAASGGVVPGPIAAVSPTLTTRNSMNFATGVVISRTLPNVGQIRTATVTGRGFTAREGSDRGVGQLPTSNRIGSAAVGLSSVEIDDLYLHDVDSGDLADDFWDWTINDPAGLTGIDFSGFVSGSDFDGANEGVRFELFLNGSATATDSFDVTGAALDNWGADRDADNLSFSNAGGPTITTATVRMSFRNQFPDANTGASIDADTGLILTPQNREALVVGASLTAIGATSGTADRELHMTNGTTTDLVKNIVFVGPSNPSELTEVDGKLFFSANDPVNTGRELWFSDGTELGTQLVQDTRTGSDINGAPLSGDPKELTSVNGKLFFSALDELNDRELWSSNPLDLPATAQVENINTGSQGADIRHVIPIGNRTFFVANDGINGDAVWVADPVAGTVTLVADGSGSATDEISGLTEFNGGVAFYNDVADATFHTDGTTTTLLTTLTPVTLDANDTLFVEAGDQLYFVHNDGSSGEELYKIPAGGAPSLVMNLNDTANTGSDPRDLVEFDNKLYFVATDSQMGNSSGREVFTTTGSSVTRVADINTTLDPVGGTSSTLGSFPDQLTVAGNRLYFTADDGANGRELWTTTGAGATLLSIRTGASGSNPVNLTDVDGTLYFAANDGTNGLEPFKSSGTPATTSMVANINGGSADSTPSGFFPAGGTVFFTATQSTTGTELWKTDGLPTGTMIVEDLQPGILSSHPVPLAAAGSDRIFVSAIGSGSVDRELWAAGGAVTGVSLAADINPGAYFGSNPRDIVELGAHTLIVADDGFSGEEVFRLTEFAPQVAKTEISDGGLQRSSIGTISVEFNSHVDIIGDPFTIINTDTAAVVGHTASAPRVENGKTIVDFTFLEGPNVNANGLLRDGNYRLTVDASLIDSLGLTLDGDGNGTTGDDYTDDFFRKFGDSDGNGFVNLSDFAAFRGSFGSSSVDPSYDAAMDDDGNGAVNLSDFAAFRGNFGS